MRYHETGGPEVLEVDVIDRPRPRQGQLLVRTTASGVSRIDTEYRRGRLPHGLKFPKQTGFDAVGEVVDSRDDEVPVGSWVAVVLGLEPLLSRGTTVEYLAVERSRCGLFPVDYQPGPDDCSLILGGLTALRAVRDALRVKAGSRVLIVGAGGPVGLASIQIARLRGARVDAVSGRAALPLCSALGAEEVFDHRRDEIDAVRSSRRYDGLLLAAGSPSRWFGAARPGARVGLTDGGAWSRSLPAALRARVRSVPVAAGHDSSDLSWLATRIATSLLTPVVGRRYGIRDVQRAHRQLGRGPTSGARIVCHEEI